MSVKPIPDGYTSIAPYLFVDDGKGAIDFYKRAFGAIDHALAEERVLGETGWPAGFNVHPALDWRACVRS